MENNINIDLQEAGCGLDRACSGEGQVVSTVNVVTKLWVRKDARIFLTGCADGSDIFT